MEPYCDRFLNIRAVNNQRYAFRTVLGQLCLPATPLFFLMSFNSDIIIKGTLLQPLLKDSSPYQPKGMPLELF